MPLLPSSVRHPVLHLPLRPRRHGRDRHRVQPGAVPVHPPGVPAAAGPGEGRPHQGPGQAAAQAGQQRIPLLLRGEQSSQSESALLQSQVKTFFICFSSQFPDNLPCSVALQPGPHDVGKVSRG